LTLSAVYSITADNDYLYAGADSMVRRRSILEIITGIDKVNPETIVKVYPNPFNDELAIITNGNKENEIKLFDITGRKILHRSFINSVSMKTAELEKGIYFYQVSEGGKIISSGKVINE
jgi:hypothetical protein